MTIRVTEMAPPPMPINAEIDPIEAPPIGMAVPPGKVSRHFQSGRPNINCKAITRHNRPKYKRELRARNILGQE